MKRLVQVALWAAFACFVNGCANQFATTIAPLYSDKVTPVASLGLTGEGASAAAPAFVGLGYNVRDLGIDSLIALQHASARAIPFVAIVDPIGTKSAWWNGRYSFSMRIKVIPSGTTVWSGTARYGSGGILINEDESTTRAMDDLVADFAKHFPPK
ncbi:MAG: hypothetical protein ABSA83_03290 [Verrucomicrobiota bacterium]